MSAFANLAGKVGVVTGGASGIGLGIARAMKGAGMKIVIADIQQDALDAAAKELGALGVRTDVSSLDSVQALAGKAVAEYGAVHVVCNNAGVAPVAKIADMSGKDWKWILDVNLWGVINGVSAFLPVLKANAGGGYIVNTASLAGLSASPQQAGYCVSKYGVVALSETLALELAQENSKIGVSVLCPGAVPTNVANAIRNRPAEASAGALRDVKFEDVAHLFKDKPPLFVQPDTVGKMVMDSVQTGQFYILTHPEMCGEFLERHEALAKAVDYWTKTKPKFEA